MHNTFFESKNPKIFNDNFPNIKEMFIPPSWPFSASLEEEVKLFLLEEIKNKIIFIDTIAVLKELVFIEFKIIDNKKFYISHMPGKEVVNIYTKLLLLYNV